MTDPLEDRLRTHLADRAAQVTAQPDPSAVVERSSGRRRIGAPLLAGAAAVLALLVGGSFATGWSVAASSPTTTTVPGGSRYGAPLARPTAQSPGAAGVDVPTGSTASVDPLAPVFTRTTGSGVTIRTYTPTGTAGGGCASSCPPTGTTPAPVPCPMDALCAHPETTPTATPGGAPGSSAGSAGRVTGDGTTSGSGGSTATTAPATTACQQLTAELSTAAAVDSAVFAAPTSGTLGSRTALVADYGSFGEAEGAPVGWVAVVVSGDVASVRLVSATGSVLDAMAPSSGVAVLAATGGSALAGTSVVGVDANGTVLVTVAAVGGSPDSGPGCTTVPPGPPVTVPTTTVPTTTVPTTTVPTTTVPPTTVPPISTGPTPSPGPPITVPTNAPASGST